MSPHYISSYTKDTIYSYTKPPRSSNHLFTNLLIVCILIHISSIIISIIHLFRSGKRNKTLAGPLLSIKLFCIFIFVWLLSFVISRNVICVFLLITYLALITDFWLFLWLAPGVHENLKWTSTELLIPLCVLVWFCFKSNQVLFFYFFMCTIIQ